MIGTNMKKMEFKGNLDSRYSCDSCGAKFELKIDGPCAIAIAYCDPCGEKLLKECPQLKEYLEKLND
jgi:transcription elongation factor Elf1